MLKRALREINRRFPNAGLPRPSQVLHGYGLDEHMENAMTHLGIREYSTVRFPVDGTSFDVTVRSNPFWQRLESRRFEANCMEYLAHLVSEGSRILDIGAGFGSYSMLFSKLSGEGGAVRAFEPDPVSRGILRDNLKRNRLRNVKVEGMCVSSAPGKAILSSRMWGNGVSTIIPHPGEDAPLRMPVQATSVDTFCGDNSFSPDGIKVDVEGAERLVLLGARRTIGRCFPWLLLEFHGGIMTPGEREETWRLATDSARKVVYLQGGSKDLSYGEEIESIPDSPVFHVFIQY